MMRGMSDIANIVHRYIDSWNETDADRRRALIAEVFTPDASYTDPLIAAKGREAIDQFVAAAQQQFAGLVFSLGGPDRCPPRPGALHLASGRSGRRGARSSSGSTWR